MSDKPEIKPTDGNGNAQKLATYRGPTVGNPEGYHQFSLAELNAASIASRKLVTPATSTAPLLGEVGTAPAAPQGGEATAPATAPAAPAPGAADGGSAKAGGDAGKQAPVAWGSTGGNK